MGLEALPHQPHRCVKPNAPVWGQCVRSSAVVLWVRMACRWGGHHLLPWAALLRVRWLLFFCSSSSQYDQVSHSWSTGLRAKAAWRFPTIKPWSALSVSEPLSSFLLRWEEPPFFGHPTYVPCLLAHFLSMPASLKTSAAPWEPELPHWVGQGINTDTVQWLGPWPPLTVGTSVCSGHCAVHVHKAGYLCTGAHTSFNLPGFGSHWALVTKQYFGASAGDWEGFNFFLIFGKLYWGHFHNFNVFLLFLCNFS